MDATLLINQTIRTLSLPQQIGGYHAGEIAIMEGGKIPSETGGREASRDEIDHMISTLEKAAASVDDRISFEFNEKTKRLIMRVTDPLTSEVVRQIPSKEVVKLLENIHDMLGVFIDEQR